MEITRQRIDDRVEVRARGRLDANWANLLSQTLEDVVREGDDRIHMNLKEVDYISSMGIRVLVTFHKKLATLQGSFVVNESSEAVLKILEMVGLRDLLMPGTGGIAIEMEAEEPARTVERETVRMEIFPLATGKTAMSYRTVGDPSLLQGCRFSERDCSTVQFKDGSFGLGLGALGTNFSECQNRFGEFLSVAGAAAYQPSDGSNTPDYLMAAGSFVPDLQVLYGLVFQGAFQSLGRFEVNGDARAVPLSELADLALEESGANQAAIIIVGESAGLVGATLRRPPVNGDAKAELFAHPEIRTWLSFTTERAFTRAMTVTLGVIARSPDKALEPFVRPLNGDGSVCGHLHAAAFPYRPLQRDRIELRKTVRTLFEQESLIGLLHLLCDDRGTSGVAQSEFVRGACWIAPIVGA